MLTATLKLCCGISQEHLRNITGLERRAVAAIEPDVTKLVASCARNLLAAVPGCIQRRLQRNFGLVQTRLPSVPAKYSITELFYVNQAEASLQRAMGIMQQPEGWHTELQQENGDCVLSKNVPTVGTTFRTEAVLDYSADALYQCIFEKMEQMSDWNPSVSKVEILQRIGKNTLVTHEVAAETLGNLIGQRDFVSVRHSWRQGQTIYLVGTATYSEIRPPQKGLIRAEAGLACFVMRPFEKDTSKTHLTWLLNVDLKGWIPKAIVNQALSQTQADFIKHLRQRLSVSSAQD